MFALRDTSTTPNHPCRHRVFLDECTHTHTKYGVMYIIYVDKIARTQHINVNVYIYVYIPNNCRSRRERRSVRGKLPSCNVRFHRLCLLYINFNRVTS